MLVSLQEANNIFQFMLEGKEWDKFSDEDKQRALGTADNQFSNLVLIDGAEYEEKVRKAFCLQAFYLLTDEDRLSLEREKRNGIQTNSTSLDKISNSYVRGNRTTLYPEVEEMIREYRELFAYWG